MLSRPFSGWGLGRALAAVSVTVFVATVCIETADAGGLAPASARVHLVSSSGPRQGIVVSDTGVYTTTDDGARWVNITPPIAHSQPTVLDHVYGITSFGPDRIWLFVSTNTGGARLIYSFDAGRQWRTTPLVPGPRVDGGAPDTGLSFLPGDANPGTPTFLDADDGWINTGLGPSETKSGLFRTSDGGAHWTYVAATPLRGQGSTVFASPTDGWGITEFEWNARGTRVATPGGVLYHTTNGGLSWRRAQLPVDPAYPRARIAFALPSFFGPDDGVVAGRLYDTRTGAEPVVVYTTTDGGTSWQLHQTPQTSATRVYQQGLFSVPFAATSRSDWAMYAGSTLYTTTDAGFAWRTIHPKLPTIVAAIDALVTTPANGTADPSVMWAQANAHQGEYFPPELIRSTNGGRSWSLLRP